MAVKLLYQLKIINKYKYKINTPKIRLLRWTIVLPAGLSPPVLAGASPPSPKAANPANGLFPIPPICNNESSCSAK